MSGILCIESDWEQLDAGEPEERVCFAALGIRHGDEWLTEAEDQFVNRVRERVHLSAYRLAEWLAWNWWRQRWEPRTQAESWALAHRMTSIGGGYVWPNIAVMSDGERVVLLARPTRPRPAEPLRYIADLAAVVRVPEFEGTVDLFLTQVLDRLDANGLNGTNLERLWPDVLAERADPEAAAYRRIEAMLGYDPDEADPATIERMLADAATLGQEAMAEIAADRSGATPTGAEIRETAETLGFDAKPSDMVRLASAATLPVRGEVAAWHRGADAARTLRAQEKLGAAPLSNKRLASMGGISSGALTARPANRAAFSFALDGSANDGHVVLRSKWQTGRRFELARLIGDRIAGSGREMLLPATQAYTYRQKLQRAFAAELLCPLAPLEDMLRADYSPEAIEDAAEHFNVSELAVRTLLVNNGRLEREDLEGDFERSAAA